MTSKRNLGPILAIAGGAIAMAAVVTGFIVIGGPGDARDRRLDDLTMGRVADALNIVQCAFEETGTTPTTIEDARKIERRPENPDEWHSCSLGTTAETVPILAGRSPRAVGDVSYEPISPTQIAICANFRRPKAEESCNGICYRTLQYEEFGAARPSGIHCFELTLVKGAVEGSPGVNDAYNILH